MSLITEESKKEAELRKRVEAAFGEDPNAPKTLKSKEQRSKESAKEKAERARKDYEQKQKTLEYKRERLEWQKERSKEKDRLRRELEARRRERGEERDGGSANIKMEPISDKDRDPTAYQKSIGGLASYTKAAVGVGARAVMNAAKKRKERKDQERQQAAERASERQKERTQSAMQQSGRLLPPGQSLGQSARANRAVRRREIEKRGGTVTEEFSCWREEFLYELKELREKKKKRDDEDYIVDVMKGKNKITIGPVVKEEYLQERKRDTAANALLSLALATNAAQSPEALVRSGHIEGPGMQLMGRMMSRRKEANRNLDSGRVSHPSRNIKKKEKVEEAMDKTELLKAIVKKLVDEKKRKNTLLIKGYIGEAKYSKENLTCNKPKADPVGDSETGKSHVVKACEGGTEKLIRFGQRGVKGSPKKKGESKAYANRRKRFKARHAKNIAKGKMSASWWSNSVKW